MTSGTRLEGWIRNISESFFGVFTTKSNDSPVKKKKKTSKKKTE